MTSCIYSGYVRHRRRRPRVHAFRYRLWLYYLDLDELPEIDRTVRLFSVNRFNAVAFHDRDHLDGRSADTRARVAALLRDAGIRLDKPKVYLLTQCRTLGHVFNPISAFYCHDGPGGPLRAVVAEVNNTFGERHLYVLRNRLNPASDASRQAVRYRAAKAMYVSPFLASEGHYDFHFAPAGPRLSVGILQYERGRPTLDAQFRGRRVALTTRTVAGLLATRPLAAVKTIAAIHGEALRLWWKGIPMHPRPPRRTGALGLRVSADDAAPPPAAPVSAAPPPAAPVPAAPPPAASVSAAPPPAPAVPTAAIAEDEQHAS